MPPVTHPSDGIPNNAPYGSSPNRPPHRGPYPAQGGDTAPIHGGPADPYDNGPGAPYDGGPRAPMHGGRRPAYDGPPPPAYRQDPNVPYEPVPHTGYGQNAGFTPSGRPVRGRSGRGADRFALIVHTLADIAAVFLGLWILLYLLDANQSNVFVDFVHGMADWLSGWSQDIFTMDAEGLRVFFNNALPAVIYLVVGHGAAAWIRRL